MNQTTHVQAKMPNPGDKAGSAGKQKQPMRLFTCGTCSHKLRFGATRCGQCWQPTPLLNQRRVYVAAGGAVVLALLAIYSNS